MRQESAASSLGHAAQPLRTFQVAQQIVSGHFSAGDATGTIHVITLLFIFISAANRDPPNN
jgi:hypothetical protein